MGIYLTVMINASIALSISQGHFDAHVSRWAQEADQHKLYSDHDNNKDALLHMARSFGWQIVVGERTFRKHIKQNPSPEDKQTVTLCKELQSMGVALTKSTRPPLEKWEMLSSKERMAELNKPDSKLRQSWIDYNQRGLEKTQAYRLKLELEKNPMDQAAIDFFKGCEEFYQDRINEVKK